MSPGALQKVTSAETKIAKVGDREVSLVGYSRPGALAHLLTHLTKVNPQAKLCSPACLARFTCGRASQASATKIRRRFSGLVRYALDEGHLLVPVYNLGGGKGSNAHGEVIAFKIYQPGAAVEATRAAAHIERMRKRGEFTLAQASKAEALLGAE